VSVFARGEVLDPAVGEGVSLAQRRQVHALWEASAHQTKQLFPDFVKRLKFIQSLEIILILDIYKSILVFYKAIDIK
jgi:phage anti-repressor protein